MDEQTQKMVIVFLGCMDLEKQIMEKRWNASAFAINDDSVFIVSGLPDECQRYREIIGTDYCNKVFYDDQATDTLSNVEGIKRFIDENHLEDYVLFCRLSRCHMWRFKKCLRMVGIENKLDLRYSRMIPEAHKEWMAFLIYMLGPIGIRFSNKVAKKRANR